MSDINFLKVDTEQIVTELISNFELVTGVTLPIGDQRRQFLQGFALPLVSALNSINETGKSNLLRFATGGTLDALGELYGSSRLEAQKAKTILKFTLSAAQPVSVTVPTGTRATPDGKLFFSTMSDLVISSGATEGTVEAEATEAGVVHNGFVMGQINKIVDGVPYVAAVTNTVASSGGADVESDESYRARLRISPFQISTAGAAKSYEYWARSASTDIGDVSVFSPNPCEVKIALVKTGGVIPDAIDPVIQAIFDACNADERRPLSDLLTVVPATAVNSSINVEYWISSNDLQRLTDIQTAVTAAVNAYKEWQTTSLGRDINPDQLRKLMLNAGAEKINVVAPVSAAVGASAVAQFSTIVVTYKGTVE